MSLQARTFTSCCVSALGMSMAATVYEAFHSGLLFISGHFLVCITLADSAAYART